MRVSYNCMGPATEDNTYCLSPGLVYALKKESS